LQIMGEDMLLDLCTTAKIEELAAKLCYEKGDREMTIADLDDPACRVSSRL
ncbi:hypothetical protein KI387_022196, partial [Taxus chinensis]